MSARRKARTSSDFPRYNEPFPFRLRALLTETGTTKQELSLHLGVTLQAVAVYTRGEANPSFERLIRIAELFGVTTDYLLGLTDVRTLDIEEQAIGSRLGLTDEAIAGLTNAAIAPNADLLGDIDLMRQQAAVVSKRTVVNLLLSTSRGKNALKLLASYFCGKLDPQAPKDSFAFITQWDVSGHGGTLIDKTMLSEGLCREILLDLAKDELRHLREDVHNV